MGASFIEKLLDRTCQWMSAYFDLDDGTYGTCEIDGAPIPEERLEVMPAARFCLKHQSEAEAHAAKARPVE